MLDDIPRHLMTWLLVLVRVGGIFVSAPVFSAPQVPFQVRALGAMALTVALAPLASPPAPPLQQSLFALIAAVVREALLGVFLGLLPAFVFLAMQYAAELIDLQVGIGMGGWIDPTFRVPASPLGNLLSLLAVALFVTIDGHHLVIEALARSFQWIPLGAFTGTQLAARSLVDLFRQMALFGVRLAAPVVAVLLVVDLGLGIVNRVAPQINLLIMTPSVKAAVAVLVLGASLPVMAVLLGHLFSGLEREAATVLRGLAMQMGVGRVG